MSGGSWGGDGRSPWEDDQPTPGQGETVYGGDPYGGQGYGQQSGQGETVFGGDQYGGQGGGAPYYGGQGGGDPYAAQPGGEPHIPALAPEDYQDPQYQDPYAGGAGYQGYGGQQYQDPGYQDPYAPAGYPPPGGGPPGVPPGVPGPPGGPPPKSGGSKTPLIIALVVVGVLVLGGLTAGGVYGVKALGGGEESPSPSASSSDPLPSTTGPSSKLSSPSAPASESRLNYRSDDPDPLTTKEFPGSYTADNGNKYTKRASKIFTSCGDAVRGSNLSSKLSTYSCTEVAAVTYVNGADNTIATVGLANLRDVSGATSVSYAVDPANDEYFKPLDGSGSAKIGNKVFWGGSQKFGHYARWVDASYTVGQPSRTTRSKKITTLSNDMYNLLGDVLYERIVNSSP